MKKILISSAVVAASFFILAAGISSAKASDFTPFTRQMDFGARNSQVTKLQTFLAAERGIYPSGMITGYYGPLTQAAVTQFQVSYGLDQVGRVGPMTIAAMNRINAQSLPLDVQAATIANLNVSTSSPNQAVITWTTNDTARGLLFYTTDPIVSNETTKGFEYPYISGTQVQANSTNGSMTAQSVVLTNLSSGRTYNFIVETVDPSGNVSITRPMSFVAR